MADLAILKVYEALLPRSFSLPASVLDKSRACFRRLQNSPAAHTLVIADLALRQDLLAKTLAMTAKTNSFGATDRAIAFLTFAIVIKQWYGKSHGYKTQSKIWKHLAESCWVLYPPLRGIIRLTLPIVSESH